MTGRIRALAARHRRFLTFCAVGGSGVAVNLATFWAALFVMESGHSHAAPAAGSWWINNVALFLGWFVSVASNFALNDRLTFRDAQAGYNAHWPRRVASYYTSAFVAFLIQWACFNGLVWALESPLGDPLRHVAATDGFLALCVGVGLRFSRTFANLAGIALATVANYLLAKHWVFRAARPDLGDSDDAGEASSARLATPGALNEHQRPTTQQESP